MEEEEKEKRKEKKRGEASRNPGPSEFWADLVLGRLGLGRVGFGPSWLKSVKTIEHIPMETIFYQTWFFLY